MLNDIDPETTRQFIIAKVSGLKILNGTEVNNDEQKGAEYDYLKLYANEWINIEKNELENLKNEFIQAHPRYPVLVESKLFNFSLIFNNYKFKKSN